MIGPWIVVDDATPAIERVLETLDEIEWIDPVFRDLLDWIPE